MLSIDIGSKYIKLLYANISGKQIVVSDNILLQTPPDAVVNGLVSDFDIISEIIGQEVSKQKWKGAKTSVVITSPDIIVREIKLPKTNSKNIKTIVSNEMSSFFSGEKYAIEYFLQNQDKAVLKAHAFAMPLSLIEDYKKMLAKAQLFPSVLDISSNCIRKINMGLKYEQDSEDIIVNVDLGYNLINFNLFYKNYLLYTRCIKMEIANETKLSAEIGSELKAENTYLTYIGDEIQKILQFLASSEYRDKNTVISVCGGGANADGIDSWLKQYLNSEVVIADNMKHNGIKGGNMKEFINALGAQIRL
ncbi:MAG: pilus assembly protein PilM [Eubacteriaceae bacterium]|nr:pilus assembly protein PilM [Eubacteriaceae bacterium]